MKPETKTNSVYGEYIRFLKENNVYDRVINQHRKRAKNLKIPVLQMLNDEHPWYYISSCSSFGNWEDELEPPGFWLGINCLWQAHMLFELQLLRMRNLNSFLNELKHEVVLFDKRYSEIYLPQDLRTKIKSLEKYIKKHERKK